MKRKITLFLVFILILLCFIVNYLINIRASVKIENELSNFMTRYLAASNLSWKKVKCNYLRKNIIIYGLNFKLSQMLINQYDGDYYLEAEVDKMILHFDNLKNLKDLKYITDFKMQWYDFNIYHYVKLEYNTDDLSEIKNHFKKIELDFEGKIDLNFFNDPMYSILPDHNLKFNFEIKGFSNNFKEFFFSKFSHSNELNIDELLEIDKLKLHLDYVGLEKKIKTGLVIANKKIKIQQYNEVSFNADRLINLEMDLFKSTLDINLRKINFKNKLLVMKIDRFKTQSNFKLKFFKRFNFMIIPDSDIKVNAKNIYLNLYDSVYNFTNHDLNDIHIDEIEFDANLADETIKVSKASINSNLFHAELEAELFYNEDFPGESLIDRAQLKISNMDADIISIFEQIENYNGFFFDRTSKGIIIDFYGTLEDIRIKS